MRIRALVIALLLAGCGSYDPPLQGDHTTAKYKTDLTRCRQQAFDTAERIAGATPVTKIESLFASNEPEHKDIRTCMVGKGYALQ